MEAVSASQNLAAAWTSERFEHSLEIEGRMADDFEHLGGRCLASMRVGKLAL